MIDELVHVALHRPIAARRVGIETAACLDCKVCCLLHRLHGEVFGRLDDDRTLTTDPGDDRGPVFVIMPPSGLTLLAATTRAAPQRLLAPALRMALLAGGVIKVIRFH